jgi:TRAP-type transport system periplasmic protein
MKSKSILLRVVYVCLALVFLSLLTDTESARSAQGPIALSKTYNWKMTSTFPAGHHENTILKRFIDTMNTRTDGKVKIALFEATLGAPTDQWDMLKNNAIQIAYLGEAYNTGRMPISSMLNLPFEVSDMATTALLYEEWTKAGYLKEITDSFKLLGQTPVDLMQFFFRNKKVMTQPDLKGMKIRTVSALHGQVVTTLGAAGVSMPGGEMYMGLQTGIIDGIITGIGGFNDRKLYETCKYAMEFPIAAGIFVLAMNKETWDSLAPELQNLLVETGREVSAADVKRKVDMEKGQWEVARKAGVTIYTISPEEKIRWKKTVSDLDDKYVAAIAAKGHPAKEALEMMRRISGKK